MTDQYIVEFEQDGEDRARYGARLLERLAGDLRRRDLKGLGDPRVLRDCRILYRLYPQIRGTLSREFVASLSDPPEVQQALSDEFGGKPVPW